MRCGLPLKRVLALQVGDTLMFDARPNELVTLRCGEWTLSQGRVGRIDDKIAVQLVRPLRRSRTTLAGLRGLDDEPAGRTGRAIMSSAINTLADCLLAVLLVATIVSCVALSRRITRLKSDESAIRKTVGELMLASNTAERAIAGLRTTLGDCDRTLAERFAHGRALRRRHRRPGRRRRDGDEPHRSHVVNSSREATSLEPRAEPAPAAPKALNDDRLGAAVRAAQALSDRAARRREGRAA